MESKTLPATPPKGKTEINKIFEALSLMNSMIIGGEQHSPVSITLYEEAMQNLAALESSLSRAQEEEKKLIEDFELHLRTKLFHAMLVRYNKYGLKMFHMDHGFEAWFDEESSKIRSEFVDHRLATENAKP